MKLSIVIVTHNSEKFLLNCLKSIYKSIDNKSNFEIIIFDNNSKNNYFDLNFNNLKIIKNRINVGLAKALNTVIPLCKHEVILSLNPDTLLKKNTIKKLYNYYTKNKNIGVAGCRVEDFNGKYQLYSRRRFPSFIITLKYFLKLHYLGFSNYYNYSNVKNNSNQYVDSISGCCMMFSKKYFYLVNGFNEKYFLFFEDTQFCIDIKDKGFNVIYLSEPTVKHYGGGSTEIISDISKKYYFYTSLYTFFIINIKKYKIFLMNCILLLIILYIILIS